MTPARPAVVAHYADTAAGRIHYAECGTGPLVLLLHQTPRSWDEYAAVLPLLGTTHRAVAMDTLGFGASDPPAADTVDAYAAGVPALLDSLGAERAVLVGHHTGAVIALETAARSPDRVAGLVLSSTPWMDAEARARRRTRKPIDEVAPRPDGSHLTALWQRRSPYYPAGRPDILARFVRDALRLAPERLEAGHRAVGSYRMEDRIGLVACPVLCLGNAADPFAGPDLEPVAAALPQARTVVLREGTVAAPEQLPEEFAAAVRSLLAELPW